MNPAEEDIRDVVPPVDVPGLEPWMAAGLAGAALLVLALAVLSLLWWLRIRRERARNSVETVKQAALRQLQGLAQRLESMDGYEFGVEVSSVLRSYLVQARSLPATSQTSQEFLAGLRERGMFSPQVEDRLGRFLGACDRLKFTPAGHAEEPNRDLLELAATFIREDRS